MRSCVRIFRPPRQFEAFRGLTQLSGDSIAVTVDTTNGDVFVDTTALPDVTVDTTNGDVELELPRDAEPELVFETTNGDLDITGQTV
jgi:DUF4097 and DUF4098 domain-containing protein YvlB